MAQLLEQPTIETQNGELPRDWQTVSFGDLVRAEGGLKRGPWGGSIRKDIFVPSGYKVYEQKNVISDDFTLGTYFVDDAKFSELQGFAVEPGDVLLTAAGTIGKIAVVPQHARPGIINQALIRIRLNEREILGAFFLFLMKYYVEGGALQRMSHGAVMNNIASIRVLRTLPLALPPLAEQRAIARVLRTVHEARRATEKVIAATRQLKQSLMRHLFTFGPVPFNQTDKVELKETEIGPIPSHWTVEPIRNVSELVSGGTPSKKQAQYWNGAIPWASPKDMKLPRLWDTEDHISQTGLDEGSRLVNPGSLFIVIRGMILTKDLPVAMAMVPMAFNQDMKAILPKSNIDGEYLLYAVVHHKARLFPEIGTSAHGTRRIGTGAINEFLLPIPPKSEQTDFARMIATIDQKVARQEQQRLALDALFQTLLHHLMTGRTRVKVAPATANGEAR